ncbi:MAG: hypothetical protein KJ893_09200 [Candidatus Omnitrophica bacterium]|nr:hypothetical protein [Candidatus Omnitrophota bacterium]MBU4478248.1 hypothetical protein [Candidatus Omnitrophota bacterium]MCG2703316.1 hypothetical protein [Candidatus Omnitrophota bacterium]
MARKNKNLADNCRNFSHQGTKAQRKDTLTGTGMNFEPLSEKEESIAERIVDAAYALHKNYFKIL